MAPRETLPPATNVSPFSGVTNQAQRDALRKSAPPPYKPPKTDFKLKDVPMAESASTFAENKPRDQVVALKQAAAEGKPFVEQCKP